MKHIIPINEFFQDVGVFGDTYGYGGANGVFKVTYKPYKDLSVTVGPDPDVPRYRKGSQYQVGDYVTAKPINSKKRIAGMVIKAVLSSDNKNYKYFVQIMSKGRRRKRLLRLFRARSSSSRVETKDLTNKEQSSTWMLPMGKFTTLLMSTTTTLEANRSTDLNLIFIETP